MTKQPERAYRTRNICFRCPSFHRGAVNSDLCACWEHHSKDYGSVPRYIPEEIFFRWRVPETCMMELEYLVLSQTAMGDQHET